MSLVRIGPAASIPAGEMRESIIFGTSYAICNVGGDYYAASVTCPHLGAPLAYGALHENIIVCPWHAWEFDCRTGRNTVDPEVKLETFTVEQRDEDLFIHLD